VTPSDDNHQIKTNAIKTEKEQTTPEKGIKIVLTLKNEQSGVLRGTEQLENSRIRWRETTQQPLQRPRLFLEVTTMAASIWSPALYLLSAVGSLSGPCKGWRNSLFLMRGE